MVRNDAFISPDILPPPSSQAFIASAWTFFAGHIVLAGKAHTVLELRRRVQDLAVPRRHLDADIADARGHRDRPPIEALPRHLAIAHADGRGLPEDGCRERLTRLRCAQSR